MTDNLPVTRSVGHAPVISAEAYQHVGRYAGGLVLACFEQIGGLDRMASWADQNPTDYFTKLLPKIISRSTQVDVSGSITIDEAISRLEGSTVEAEFTEVSDAVVTSQKEYDL